MEVPQTIFNNGHSKSALKFVSYTKYLSGSRINLPDEYPVFFNQTYFAVRPEASRCALPLISNDNFVAQFSARLWVKEF